MVGSNPNRTWKHAKYGVFKCKAILGLWRMPGTVAGKR